MTTYTLAALLPAGAIVTLATLARREPRSAMILLPGVIAMLALVAMSSGVYLATVPIEVGFPASALSVVSS